MNVNKSKLQSDTLNMAAARRSVILSLLYFEVFYHPLTRDELIHYSRIHLNQEVCNAALQDLVEKQVIKSIGKYYFIDLSEDHVRRRIDAENRYEKNLKKAERYSSIIASFPFVKSVCISGSLSKGVSYEGGDIDYFIITKPRRLWIAKLLLVLFKRTVLLGSHKNFCLNYFLDNDHLELEEINLFTATELASVMPMYGYQEYENLIKRNPWLKTYYPNFRKRDNDLEGDNAKSRMKKGLEFLFDNRMGATIGNQFMKIVWRKYNRKHENPFTKDELNVMFKTKSYVSKVHYGNHQQVLLNKMDEKCKAFEEKHGISITRQIQ